MSSDKDKISDLEAEIKRLNELVEQLKAEVRDKGFINKEQDAIIADLLAELAEYDQEDKDKDTDNLN